MIIDNWSHLASQSYLKTFIEPNVPACEIWGESNLMAWTSGADLGLRRQVEFENSVVNFWVSPSY